MRIDIPRPGPKTRLSHTSSRVFQATGCGHSGRAQEVRWAEGEMLESRVAPVHSGGIPPVDRLVIKCVEIHEQKPAHGGGSHGSGSKELFPRTSTDKLRKQGNSRELEEHIGKVRILNSGHETNRNSEPEAFALERQPPAGSHPPTHKDAQGKVPVVAYGDMPQAVGKSEWRKREYNRPGERPFPRISQPPAGEIKCNPRKDFPDEHREVAACEKTGNFCEASHEKKQNVLCHREIIPIGRGWRSQRGIVLWKQRPVMPLRRAFGQSHYHQTVAAIAKRRVPFPHARAVVYQAPEDAYERNQQYGPEE